MLETSELRTNRDLYLFIASLGQDAVQTAETTERERSLEDYLKVLWQLGTSHQETETLSLATFAGLLDAALHRDAPPPFEVGWSHGYHRGEDTLVGYARWERTILDQIVDLHEMQDAGILANEHRYFGVDSPRGSRWYNFAPLTYLECAMAGTFNGWRPGDSTGRDFVPGPVAVMDEAGHITSADPRDLEDPICPIDAVSWDMFADFLECGRCYE